MLRSFATVTLLALYTAACGKSPDAVCSKFEKLAAKSDKKEHAECVKELTEMKEISPQAYKCVAGCSEKDTVAAASGCVSPCVFGDEKLNTAAKKRLAKQQEVQEGKLLRLAAAPSKSFDGKLGIIDGKLLEPKTLIYSLSLSEGFAEGIETANRKRYELKDEDEDADPFGISVEISKTPFSDLDERVKVVDGKVVKQANTDKGYILLSEYERTIRAEVVMKSDENVIACEASATGEVYLKNKDKLLPWFEKMCSSLVIK